MKRKNILLIIPSSTGTIPKVSFNIYKAISKVEHINIYVANLHHSGISGYSSNVEYVYKGPNTNFHKLIFLYKLKKKLKIDISISTLTNCNTLNVLSSFKDIKIGVFHAPLAQTKKLGNLAYVKSLLSYFLLYNHLDRIYAVNQTVKQELEKYCRRGVELVYNIHDFQNIHNKASEKLTQEEIDIFSNPTILFVGDIIKSKGVSRLLNSFAILKKQYHGVLNLVFLGKNAINEPLEDFVNESINLGIERNVFFLGYKNNPYKYMKNCTMLVSPSYSEGLPGVLIETLFLNKKVVSTNSSKGVWEIMQCYNNYNENLSEIFLTGFGYITPNILDNELYNQEMLAKAMYNTLEANDDNVLNFDFKRFSAENIVDKYIL